MMKKKWISKRRHPKLIPRVIVYLIVIMIIQSALAYGALLLFEALPNEFTGLDEEDKVFYDAFRGPANMISEQLKGDPVRDQATISRLQTKFSYPLKLIPISTSLNEETQKQFQKDYLAFDDKKKVVYIKYDSPSQLLQMGPILDNDILSAELPVWILFLFVWSIISAIVFLCLLFLACSPLWHDAITLRKSAEKIALGDLKNKTTVQSWLFKPLAEVLNNMVMKVDQLVHNSKAISHAMAHELRTPITRLRFGLVMLSEAKTDAEKNRQLNGINKDIEELESLINVSLNFFKMQQQEIALSKTTVSLLSWIQELSEALKQFKPVNLELNFNVEDEMVEIDTNIVNIAVNNLLLNAFNYTKRQMEIDVFIQEGCLFVEVSDDGSGIPLQSREEIFSPFLDWIIAKHAKQVAMD